MVLEAMWYIKMDKKHLQGTKTLKPNKSDGYNNSYKAKHNLYAKDLLGFVSSVYSVLQTTLSVTPTTKKWVSS